MNIKKHKIKISSDSETSGFILDLRPIDDENIDNISESRNNIFDKKNKSLSFDFKKKSEHRINNKKIKESLKKLLFFKLGTKKEKNSKKNNLFNKVKKISIFYLLYFIFKIFRNIILFISNFFIDIYCFFSERINFSGRKKRKSNSVKKNKKKVFSSNKKDIIKIKKRRPFWLFILILFLLVIPFKIFSYYRLATEKSFQDDLWGLSSSALENFVIASDKISQLDLGMAQKNFFQAGENFLLLDKELEKMDDFIVFLASFSGDEKIRLASESKKISQIGIDLSSAGNNFSLAMDSLMSAFSEGEPDVSSKFSNFEYYLNQAEKDFKNINKYLNKIKESSIPDEYLEKFIIIKDISKILEKNLSDLRKALPGLKDFLAIDSDKRYLIVFQNNSEIRATGGFIGSYALLDLKKGKIKNIEIPPGGSYDTEGGTKVLMESPRPLHLVKPIWYFWDANWWPDWKMSAQNLMWFYEKSGGPSVDGVIGLTPDVLADILKIIGPIDLNDKYGVVINSENFLEIIQEIVEVIGQPEIYQDKNLKTDILSRVDLPNNQTDELSLEKLDFFEDSSLFYDEVDNEDQSSDDLFLRNEPKKIIGELMAEILDEFSSNFNKELLLGSLGVMEENLTKKNILLYFVNNKMQLEVENRSWAGRVKDSPLDYLMVVNSSVAGGKTDYFIENDFKLEIEVDESGDILNKLIIKRSHNGVEGDLFSNTRNINWLRVYVPLGSTLVSAKGFSSLDSNFFKPLEVKTEKNIILEESENKAKTDILSGTKIYQEADKTVFANWNITDPGDENCIEIVYKLPYNLYSLLEKQNLSFWNKLFPKDPSQNYSLLWQKQAGSRSSSLDISFSSSLNLDPVWTYPDNISGNLRQIEFKSLLEKDRYFVIMLK